VFGSSQQIVTCEEDKSIPLRLNLHVLADELLPCQPVRLLVSAQVAADRPFRGALTLSPEAGRGWVDIAGQGRQRTISFREVADPMLAPGDWLPPATAQTYPAGYQFETETDLLLLYDVRAGEYVIPEAGRYEVRVRIQGFEGQNLASYRPFVLKSNTVELPVGPVPDDMRFALSRWTWPWQASLVIGSKDGFAAILSVVPDSSYAQYARYALSQCPNVPIAEQITYLKQSVERILPSQIADLALLQLGELLRQQQDYEGSRSYTQRVLALSRAPKGSHRRAAELLARVAREDKQ